MGRWEYDMANMQTRWLHAIVKIPDGRVLACRTHYGNPAGTTEWMATVGISALARKNHVNILTRRLNSKFGIKSAKAEHIATHTPPKSAYDYKSYYPIEIYLMSLEKATTLHIAKNVETMALSFKSLIDDLDSGAWGTETIEVFNVIDGLKHEISLE